MAKNKLTTKKRKKKLFKKFFWGVFGLSLLLAFSVSGWLYWQWQSLPSVVQLREWHPAIPLRIYANNGQLLAQIGPKLQDSVTLNEAPRDLGNAFVAAESGHFWSHNFIYFPVNYPAILRAAWVDVTHFAPVQGASTITEQVARNFYLSPQKTIVRKVRQILLAYKLAMHFDRRQILTLYLNKIYFGYGAYGVGAASRIYYGKAVDQLTLPEMAMLAGMPAAPNYYNPLNHPSAAKERRNYVIRRMLADNYITKKEASKASSSPLTARYHSLGNDIAPYVVNWITSWLEKQYGPDMTYETGMKVYTTIDPRLQKAANQSVAISLENYSMGLDSMDPQTYEGPITHLNARSLRKALRGIRPWQLPLHDPANLRWAVVLKAGQKSAKVSIEGDQKALLKGSAVQWAFHHGRLALKRGDLVWVRKYIDSGKPPGSEFWMTAVWHIPQKSSRGWQLSEIPKVQGALVSLDNVTGAMVALVGGFSYELSHFDRALYAYRQPGSSFKPFVYAAALDGPELLAAGENDYLTQSSLIADTPLSVKLPNGKVYKPTNYSNKFSNTPIPVWKDLAESINVPSVRILMQIGLPYAVHYVQQFGFPSSEVPPVPSLVLGSADVTPLQMARAYAVFSNGGFLVKPYLITRVESGAGKLLAMKKCVLCESDIPPKQVITTGVAYLVTRMLQRVIRDGTGVAAHFLGHHLAGKTGTTNDQKNAWFVGYSRHYVAATWVGYDDNHPMVRWAAGAREALPMWIHYMQAAVKGYPSLPFFQPPDIVQAAINPKTGLRTDSGGQIFDYLNGFLPPTQNPLSPENMATNQTTSVSPSVQQQSGGFIQQYGNQTISGSSQSP